MINEHHQIGEVAEQVGLSLRTIRYYEEIGMVTPSGRTDGGFRLYTASDIERLELVKALKPIGMSLETLKEMLDCVDGLRASADGTTHDHQRRLDEVLAIAHERCQELEESLEAARKVLRSLGRRADVGGR